MNGTPAALRPRPVRISSDPAYLDTIGPLLSAAQAAVGDVPALLDLAKAAGATAPKPGDGRTAICGNPRLRHRRRRRRGTCAGAAP